MNRPLNIHRTDWKTQLQSDSNILLAVYNRRPWEVFFGARWNFALQKLMALYITTKSEVV